MTAPIVEGLGPIPTSPTLTATLAHAANFAQSQQHVEVTLEHLLLALIEDDDARIVMTSVGVDLDRLKTDVSNHIGRIEERLPAGHPGTAAISDDLRRILNAAAAAASGRRNDINGAIVLAAIIGDAQSSAAAILQAHGLTFGAAIEVVKQRFGPDAEAARQQSRPATQPPAPAHEPESWPKTDADSVLADARMRIENRRSGSPEAAPRIATSEPAQAQPPHSAKPAAPATVKKEEPSFAPDGAGTPSSPRPNPMQPAPAPAEQARRHAPVQPPAGPTWTPPPSHVQPPQPPPHRAPPPLNPNIGMRPPPPTGPFRTDGLPSAGVDVADQAPRPSRGTAPAGTSARQPFARQQPVQGPDPRRPRAPLPPVEEVFGAPAEPAGAAQRQTGAGSAPAPAHVRHAPVPPARAKREGAASKKRRRARTGDVQTGQLIENIPRVMRVALPSLVEARIAKSEVKNLADGIAGDGAAYRHDVLITRAMTVKLRAPDGGFFIETSSPETQWIENALGLMADDYASWRWTVTPKARGRRRLQLIISARTVGADGVAAETALPDQVVEIKVRTNYARALTVLLGWVIAALVGGLLATFGEGILAAIGTLFKSFGS